LKKLSRVGLSTIFFLAVLLPEQVLAREPEVVLWDGSSFQAPEGFTELEIQMSHPPFFLVARAPAKQMGIILLDLGNEKITSSVIREALAKAVHLNISELEHFNWSGGVLLEDTLIQSYKLKSLISGNRQYLVLAPLNSDELYMDRVLKSIAKKEKKQEPQPDPIDFSLLEILLTVSIFMGFLIFIFMALKVYSHLSSGETWPNDNTSEH